MQKHAAGYARPASRGPFPFPVSPTYSLLKPPLPTRQGVGEPRGVIRDGGSGLGFAPPVFLGFGVLRARPLVGWIDRGGISSLWTSIIPLRKVRWSPTTWALKSIKGLFTLPFSSLLLYLWQCYCSPSSSLPCPWAALPKMKVMRSRWLSSSVPLLHCHLQFA